ncbi:Rab-like protein 3 [Mortierella sp. 14UC]|nr:Rab-like protein 3 [Mortierella sp. 14UC]
MNPYSSHSSQDASYKVLVLGDSGVGKSSLVHILCTNEHLRAPVPTVGCEINVRLHSSTIPTAATTSTARSGFPSLLASRSTNSSLSVASDPSSSGSTSEPTFIEFYDVSGSPAVRHPKSRSMYYSGVVYQGIILVHDLCNRRSYENLWKWIADYMEASSQGRAAGSVGGGGGGASWPSSNLQGALNIPLLVVGTKNDIATGTAYSQGIGGNSASTGQELVAKYGGEAISVCTISAAEFMPNSSTSIAFNMFFNQIIDPRTNSQHGRSDSHGHYRPQHQTISSFNSSTSNNPPPPHVPGYTRQPPTPTPEQQYHRHNQRNQDRSASSNDTEPTSPSIPTMDFATFAGGGASTVSDTLQPTRRVESPTPARSIIPTGNSSSTGTGASTAHSTTKSSLRAQYERNRTVLGQYNSGMGVPTYTSRSNNSSRSHTPSGSRS